MGIVWRQERERQIFRTNLDPQELEYVEEKDRERRTMGEDPMSLLDQIVYIQSRTTDRELANKSSVVGNQMGKSRNMKQTQSRHRQTQTDTDRHRQTIFYSGE